MHLHKPTTAQPSEEDVLLGDHAISTLSNVLPLSAASLPTHNSSKLPSTSSIRISKASTTLKTPRSSSGLPTSSDPETVLYLAYGSNLSAETFKGARGIQPISAVNVHVPSLDLTFDLAGIPYSEPCFANTQYRHEKAISTTTSSTNLTSTSDYHKNHWHKGLIGVVYEVTLADYRTIIATEGGGASYQDVLVPCYVLPRGITTVDHIPHGATFEAHTLLSPPNGRISRPDPNYAQPSARYLKLITDGANEHALPAEYREYLGGIRPYTITTARQRVGKVILLGIWGPVVGMLFLLGRMLADKEGRVPKWLAWLMGWVFGMVWVSYDMFFRGVFGDGERTVGDEEDDGANKEKGLGWRWCKRSNEFEIDTVERQ